MKQSVFISGITGFVGANLKKYLFSNYNVIGVYRKGSANITYDKIGVDDFDNKKAFVHLAGKAHDLKNTSERNDYFEVNTELTKKVFRQFLESQCDVFIYISSVKAVADKVNGVLDESCIPNPITAYGESKLAAENFILSQKIPQGKRVYILRPCMIHGPKNKGNLNLLYSVVSKGIPYPFGKFKNERSFVSVENLCFIIEKLIENKHIESGIYNIADDDFLSTNELVKLIGNVTGKPAKIWNISKKVIHLIARIGDVLPFPINSDRVDKLTENYKVSNAKIKKVLNISKLPVSAREGLEKTIKSFS